MLHTTLEEHYSRGSKLKNCLLTRLRVGRSDLNLHKFTIGQVDKPECICHSKEESTKHYFLDCFLYTAERQTLFALVEHYIPKFTRLSKAAKFDILLYGHKTEDEDYEHLNTKITIISVGMVFIFNLDKLSLKKLFPTMNI